MLLVDEVTHVYSLSRVHTIWKWNDLKKRWDNNLVGMTKQPLATVTMEKKENTLETWNLVNKDLG